MSTHGNLLLRWLRRLLQAVAFLGFAAGVVVLMLWLAGKFSPKVPATNSAAQSETSRTSAQLVPVALVELPLTESAVGTIRAVHETSIGSKLLARVVEVNLKAGQKVHAGDVLIRLDDSDLRARLQQAQAAAAAAEATYTQAATNEKRYNQLVTSRTISQQEYDNWPHGAANGRSESPPQPSGRSRGPSHARLRNHPISARRHGDRQESRCRRHGHAGPAAGHALRPDAHATGGQRSRIADPAAAQSTRASACESRGSTNNAAERYERSCPRPNRPAARFR